MERLTGVFPASAPITLDGMQFYAGPSAVQKRGVSASPSIKQREGADGRFDLGGNAQTPQDMAACDVDTDAQSWGIGATVLVLILEYSRNTDTLRNRVACFEYHWFRCTTGRPFSRPLDELAGVIRSYRLCRAITV